MYHVIIQMHVSIIYNLRAIDSMLSIVNLYLLKLFYQELLLECKMDTLI